MLQSNASSPGATRHAVILAAGESRRTRPLTLRRPKPLIPLAGQPLLAHILDELVGLITQVTLVVGYRAEDIQRHFGDSYRGIDLCYVHQQQISGTASALLSVADQVHEPFLMLYGDNLISRADLLNVCQQRYCMAALPVAAPQSFGILQIADDHVVGIIEKPAQAAPGSLANPGIFHFDQQVFSLLRHIRPSPRGEYELTDVIGLLAQSTPVGYSRCTGHWIPVGTPWEALIAALFLLQYHVTEVPVSPTAAQLGPDTLINQAVQVGQAQIGANCRIIGPTMIDDGVVIGNNCVIEHSMLAAGVTIGDNCVIRHSALHTGVLIGADCTVASSVLDDGACIGAQTHLPARQFPDIVPTAHTMGRLEPALLYTRGAVLGPGVLLPAGTTLEPGTIVCPAT